MGSNIGTLNCLFTRSLVNHNLFLNFTRLFDDECVWIIENTYNLKDYNEILRCCLLSFQISILNFLFSFLEIHFHFQFLNFRKHVWFKKLKIVFRK